MTTSTASVAEISAGLPYAPAPATADEVLAAAERLVPVLRERAAETDRERRIAPETFRLIQEAGVL